MTNLRPREQAGAALIIVVAFLALITGLVVAFYARVGTDLANSRSYAEGVSARQLADSAVGVVMAQIREATAVKNGAWASQPGMIRVYGTGKEASAAAHAFYKLYSSHDLIVSAEEMKKFDPLQYDQAAVATALEVPLGKGGWRDQPAYFTDLNEPALVAASPAERVAGKAGVKRYPIFDPSIAALHDPAVAEPSRFERPWLVEGSSIALPKNLRESEKEPNANEAPMPTRWIYVLRDGTLTAPAPLNGPAAAREGSVAHWRALSGGKYGIPTQANPIVGRIAFWADDDSSKVNVNTAGGFVSPPGKDEDTDVKAAMDYAGSFWDTPRVMTVFDRGTHKKSGEELGLVDLPGLANCQPAQNEFQRYPGHPATTSLDVVFKRLLKKNAGGAASKFDSEKLYAWLPRLLPGGSRGGTVRLDAAIDREMPIKSGTDMLDYPEFPSLTGKMFHLFGSVDEMLFSPENGPRRLAEEFLELPQGTITPDLLDKTRFFLTAHSRAPELNLFGRPRVTIWPIWDEPFNTSPTYARNNPTDALLRFCSRIGGRDFIFARQDPYSTKTDFNIPRNRALFEYLRRLTSQAEGKIPGFGGSFEEKLINTAGGRDQLLAEIFDYIRVINLKDTTRFKDIAESGHTNAEIRAEKEKYMYAPRGVVVPTRAEVDGKQIAGFGRFPTISEASIVFYHAGWVGRPREGENRAETLIQDPDELLKYDVTHKLVRAFLVFETYNPMQGYAPTSSLNAKTEKLVHELDLGSDFTIRSKSMPASVPLGFPTKASNEVHYASGSTWGGRNFGGTEGFFHTIRDKIASADAKNPAPWANPASRYPSCTYAFRTQSNSKGGGPDGARIPVNDTEFDFSGGKAELAIKFNSQIIQTIKLDFPPAKGWALPRGMSDAEAARLNWEGEGSALWPDLGGFMKTADLNTPLPRPNVRREWFHSFERRLAWMITSAGDNKEHSHSPWLTANGGDGNYYTRRWRNILQPGDTIRSLVLGRKDRPDLTDPRLLAIQRIAEDSFSPHPNYDSKNPRAETLRLGNGTFYFNQSPGALVDLPAGKSYPVSVAPDLPTGIVAKRHDRQSADFDTGVGSYPDGAYGGKTDEGNVAWRYWDSNANQWRYVEPYFSSAAYDPPMDTFFSPNRQIPSAVMFGSLLSSGRGWETLVFSPNPAGEHHPGLASPRDHLLLDLFHMPVVEPYAISEPFSTAGKVNLNYQIMPFGYLKRSTALRAALQSVRVTGIPQVHAPNYKTQDVTKPKMGNVRYLVDRDETLRAFDDFFAEFKNDRSKGFFKSASEICDRFLYPKGETHAGKVTYRSKAEVPIRQTFWANSTLTGDNLREKPYADLYPRVTTKSNTFTVHYRVQTLRQRPPSGDVDIASHYLEWDESRDSVLSELRGHTTIERYLDPEDKRFHPGATGERIDVEKESLEDAYRFRIIYHKRFTPW